MVGSGTQTVDDSTQMVDDDTLTSDDQHRRGNTVVGMTRSHRHQAKQHSHVC
jgi:hypothetical protein